MQGDLDHAQHAFDILQNIVVPEAQDPIAATDEKLRSSLVFGGSNGMLSAIKLNNDLSGSSGEIADEWTDWDLPIEAGPAELTITKVLPKFTFGLGCVVA